MIYKYTLLKDLPDMPAGTSETHSENQESYLSRLHQKHPTWVIKEIDSSKFVNLNCPNCGRNDQYHKSYGTYQTSDDDVYYRHAVFYLDCACGEKTEVMDVIVRIVAYNKYI